MSRGADGRVVVEEQDVVDLGNVDDALAQFYVDAVHASSIASGVSEQEIRAWFDDHLITQEGFRNQVLDGPGDSGDVVLRELEDAHLIRGDTRRGATWYELSHDRLVDPVRMNNASWRATTLSNLQREAMAWARDPRPGLLITGSILAEAEEWAAAHPDELSPTDHEYLDACRDEESRVLLLERTSKRNRWLALVSSGLAIVAVIGLLFAYFKWREAQDANESANRAQVAAEEAAVLAAESESIAVDQQAIAEQAAREAIEEKERADAANRQTEAALATAEEEQQRAEAAALRAATSEMDAVEQQAIAERAAQDAIEEKERADAANEQTKVALAAAEEERQKAEAAEAEALDAKAAADRAAEAARNSELAATEALAIAETAKNDLGQAFDVLAPLVYGSNRGDDNQCSFDPDCVRLDTWRSAEICSRIEAPNGLRSEIKVNQNDEYVSSPVEFPAVDFVAAVPDFGSLLIYVIGPDGRRTLIDEIVPGLESGNPFGFDAYPGVVWMFIDSADTSTCYGGLIGDDYS